MRGLSIDIGVHNMAFYIEEFDSTLLKGLVVPKNSRYTENGEATIGFKDKILKSVYENGKKIFLDKSDLSDKKGVKFRLDIFINLTEYLDRHSRLFDECDFIIIEQQMRNNPMAQRIEQHCVSWFTFTYLDTKQIIIFPSKNKTRVLGAPKKLADKKGRIAKMSKPQRKKWACDEASRILSCRNDMETMSQIFVENKGKSDDLSDVICQMQAFKIKLFIDGVSK
jgi:hypothetical protein